MKTFFVSYRVTDLDRSLVFLTALGYAELGKVEGADGARRSGRPVIPTASQQEASPETATVQGRDPRGE